MYYRKMYKLKKKHISKDVIYLIISYFYFIVPNSKIY